MAWLCRIVIESTNERQCEFQAQGAACHTEMQTSDWYEPAWAFMVRQAAPYI
jgi:hypothetical protein